ncbi:MAG: TIGR02206 family membrane protein, partial [bacterium]
MGASQDHPFVMFGLEHFSAVLTILALTVLLPVIIRRSNSAAAGQKAALILGVVLLLIKATEPIIRVDFWSELNEMLPLHLCDVGGILAGIMLLNRNYFFYELTYFWGFGGTLQAILTPDLQRGFPHVDFLYYFTAHGLIIVAAVYATVMFKYRPVPRSILRALMATVIYAVLMIPVNWFLNTNYLYLCHKPTNPSLMDYLGPWPWYIFTTLPVALFFYTICYTPF